MNRLLFFSVFLLLASTGCVESTKQVKELTPSDVVKNYADAHNYENFEEMYSLMSSGYRASYPEERFRTLIEAPRRAMEQQGNPIKFVKVTGEKIDGDRATVEFLYEMQGAGVTLRNTVELIKEPDGWKITQHDYRL